MAVHIFTLSESNYEICVKRGIVGIPEAKDSSMHDNIFDGLLSRLACIKDDDYILMYIISKKELRGVWQADGEPYYEESKVWEDRLYPFRCKIKCSIYNFSSYLSLNDINDLRNSGKIWTWSLQRASGANSMFSISDYEFSILLNEYIKINPFSLQKGIIPNPSPFHENNVIDMLHTEGDKLKYEYTVMAFLSAAFSQKKFVDIFGNYIDFLCYVPTNLGKEMDALLFYENPNNHEIVSYDIIEVKREEFDVKALTQLIGYESWFLQKKISGDMNMLRTTAIAGRFSEEVIDYVNKRKIIENKPIKLLRYLYKNGRFFLERIN